MKLISTLVAAVLLCIAAALWFAGHDEETNATQEAVVSGGFEDSQRAGGDGATPQQPGPRQRDIPSEDSTDHRDVGSPGANDSPTGVVAVATPQAEKVAVPDATEAPPGRAKVSASPEPPPIDKTACESAAKTLSEARRIYDVTPTHAIAYAKSRPPDSPSAFHELQARLSAHLCSGTDAFDRAYPVESAFVAISAESHTRILVGDHWISDGTVLSFLPELDQDFFGNSIIQSRRRRVEAGHNILRDRFERQLARNPQALAGEP